MTPVLAAQLDDPYCLRRMHTWLGFWHARAASLATSREEHLRRTGAREAAAATHALAVFEQQWQHGGCAGAAPRWRTPALLSSSAARPRTRSCR